MATPDSTGVERRRVRLDGNRPRTHPSPSFRRNLARKSLDSPRSDDVRERQP
jgi:hypothetical protein